uniref:Vesicle transport protein n=1 Tax=Percolomonas cosmopolitus TaxID=63605 RepID=A0A7S1KNE3_9EUKA
MSSYFSNLTNNFSSLIPTTNQSSYSYSNLSRGADDTKSLTRYSDENALSDSDEDWKMSMLQEELNGNTHEEPKRGKNMALSHGNKATRNAPVLHDISSDEEEGAIEIHAIGATDIKGENSSSWFSSARNAPSWLTRWNTGNVDVPPPPNADPLILSEDSQQQSSVTDRIKSLVSEASKKVGLTKEPPKPKKWYERWRDTINEKVTLSKRTRLYGFAITFIIGLCCMGVSLFLLSYALVPLIARLFAILYTFGQICFILSSFFLAGPITQIKQMVTPKRIIPSTIYLISLLLTIVSAIRMKSIILCFILIVIQIIALGFYVITYIPYSGTFLSMMVRGVWNSM